MKIYFKLKDNSEYEFYSIKKLRELITNKLNLENNYANGLVQGITEALGEIEVFKICNIRII